MKKERFVDWWKQDKRYMTLLKAVLMALLPLLCCLVRTAAEGRSIGQVYLPSSEWNDELFYFKQVPPNGLPCAPPKPLPNGLPCAFP